MEDTRDADGGVTILNRIIAKGSRPIEAASVAASHAFSLKNKSKTSGLINENTAIHY